MTTFEPGARLVFTHGLRVRPFAAAFFASRPAAIITDGFDVFVQLVIAAITAAPSSRSKLCWPSRRALSCLCRRPSAGPLICGAGRRSARIAVLRPLRSRDARLHGREVEHSVGGVARALVACGRVPAPSRMPRRDRPAPSAGPRAQVAQRLVVDRKDGAGAPYSGDMLPIVARSASGKPARPSPKNSTNFPPRPSCAASGSR